MPDSFAYLPEIWTDDPSEQHGIGGLSVKKVDVSGSGMIFRTCSGISNAGSATSASKSQDLKLALNWLYNKKNFKVRSNYPNGFSGGAGTEYTVNFSVLGNTEPLNRIKAVADAQQLANGFDGMGLLGFSVQRYGTGGFRIEAFDSTFNSNNILTRMYNGNVNNENNFIGYGVSGFTSAIQSDDMDSIGGTDLDITTAFGMSYFRATGRFLTMKMANYANITGFQAGGDAFKRIVFQNTNLGGVNFITLATGSTNNIGDPPPQVSLSLAGSGGLFGVNWSSDNENYFVQFTETNDWF